MAEYIVFRTNTIEDVHDLHFAYHIEDAFEKQEALELETGYEYDVAEVIPTDSWIMKFYRFLHTRSN
jgi:hypothetical protein